MAASQLALGERTPDLQQLYREHHGWLQAWLLRRLGHAGDAADLAQDTFLRLLLRPASRGFGSPGEARAYLRTAAGGLCVDLWRRRELERAWLDTLAVLPEALAPSPEQQALVIEALMEIARLLERLPEKAARAFLLAQLEGLSYREIAAELGVSERMVKKYMAQAMLQCALVEAGLAA